MGNNPKKTMSTRKKSKIIVSSCAMALMLLQPVVTPVLALTNEEGSAATNLVPQQKPNEINADSIANSGKKEGSIKINVDRTALDKAVKDAKALGLTVKQGETKNVGPVFGKTAVDKASGEISTDYASQAKAITDATASYKKQLDQYEKDLAEYKANQQTGGAGTVTGTPIEQYMSYGMKAEPNAKISDISVQGTAYLVKSSDMGITLANMAGVVSGNKWTQINDSNALSELSKVVYKDDGAPTNAPDAKSHEYFNLVLKTDSSITITYKGLKNSSIDGSDIGAVKVTYKPTSKGGTLSGYEGFVIPANDPVQPFLYGVASPWIDGIGADNFWGNAQSASHTTKFFDKNMKNITLSPNCLFFIKSLNNSKVPDASIAPNPSKDVDQKETVSFPTANGKAVPFNASTVGVLTNSGGTTTVGPKAYNDYKSNATITPKYDSTEWDNGGAKAYYGAIEYVPNEGTDASFNFHTTVSNAWAQVNGQMNGVGVAPKKPDAPEVTYNYQDLLAQLDDTKSVANIEEEDINGQLVNKQTVHDYTLNAEPLPAGHEKVEKLIFSDPLPDGFAPNVDATKEKSPDYEVAYDEETNTMTFTAKKETLDALNKDLTKEVKIPAPIIEGTVTNDNATYQNDFTLTINDFTVVSNVVETHTPGGEDPGTTPEPSKVNEDKEGNDISGQTVEPGTVNYYKITWDLDQYKDIVSSKDDIAKGFVYVDDAPEEVDIQVDKTTYQDSEGKAVKGITAQYYSSVKDAPKDLQALLKDANINPKGQFVTYTADDPQSFFDTYVKTGNNITIRTPMTLKPGFTGEYENMEYQIDFGNGYSGNLVKNNVPEPKEQPKETPKPGKDGKDGKDGEPGKTKTVTKENKPLADTGAALGQHIWGLVIAGLAMVAGLSVFIIKKLKKNNDEY
ncbi:SspB-related isopeptide-forming adhesin [Lactococcus garvieae]|uniref:SspB-related isopeptide-forming adhesin n=1 Tax=Lactococcus garvieae TaxID=1363 RepID=UPI00254CDF5C|nr:SspB-related isopeptide-forming adhesin [Lactococcus garvieae]